MKLPQLTYLALSGVWLEAPALKVDDPVELQHLSGLTRLVDLRLEPRNSCR
jgi:hypothetical protein